jgi:hypothetical protein
MINIDWRDARHWNRGRTRSCRLCGRPSMLLDSAGRPAHKVCVEAAISALQEKAS